ncbi:candidate protein kinase c [Ceraceosorus bombacis]|uniref:protein kinase C n=1 Tax=Ceraceosorus bombacis TaxID=401625 RepID=A0A0P1BJB2_9BASI|nr:candidate protein kinase c [Ceraceosorus bombacis]
MADSTDSHIADVLARVQVQRKHMEAAQAVRGLTSNQDVIRNAEAQIRDAQRNISYLEESLRQLQDRRASSGTPGRTDSPGGVRPGAGSAQGGQPGGPQQGYASSTHSAGNNSSSSFTSPYAAGPESRRPYPGDSSSSYVSSASSGGWNRFEDRPLPAAPGHSGGENFGSPGGQGEWRPAPIGRMGTSAKKQYTNLDLIKYDTPHTTAKISRMLHQLEFKLQIEKQMKVGIDKMAKLYSMEGDRKSKNDAESKRVESEKKLVLLQQSLKRYKQLHVMEESGEDEMPGSIEDRRQKLRKPLSGTLQVSVRSARDIDHAPNARMGRSVRESTVVIKVEDTPRARTHPSRTDRWQEDFEVAVDNANEIEVTVYDRVGSAHPVPVGMLWIRISDIVEELRKKKFGQVSTIDGGTNAPGGWGTAEDVAAEGPGARGFGGVAGGGAGSLQDASFHLGPAGAQVPLGPTQDGVEAWFAVEPAGAIFLRLNFIKQNVRKRPYDARLGRQGAVRKRKEDVAEINGHKFISRQFYQIVRCALCGELLLNATGSQCEDCRYTCHKKCAQKVVTKCISKSNAETERDEVKIKHRIPHRFVPLTNISANWCCHCGYILPLGRKNARKCAECDITAHSDCAHLVPDLCGMSMELANQLLADMEAIDRVKSSAKTQLPSSQQQFGGGQANGGRIGAPRPTFEQPALGVKPPRPLPQQPPTGDGRVQSIAQSASSMQVAAPAAAGAPASRPVIAPTPSQASIATIGAAPAQAPAYPPSSKRKIGLNDFNFLAVLGKGNFGKVMLAEEKRSGYLYAIKVLKKEFIIENDEVESTKSEKRVFLAAARERHPFLLGLHSCFQTETRVYFVMEYVSGGDLMLHIQREQFTPRRAKFYAAEVLLALEYFHKQGIIYRDLKLDNILLTLDGHIKVADYGLCKEDMWYGKTTSTFCGTPEFMAPEILLEQRYGRAVDWWAFGILIYEMLLGQAPFRGDDEDEIFDAILEDEPLYPIHMPPDSVSILHKLLTRDPARRLGSGATDAEEIKAHPFFRDINWDDMFHKRVPPPFCPTLKNPSDTSWFDSEFTSEKPTLTPVHSVLSTQDQAEFKSFSWTAPHVM